jgi:hypothetical protein
LTGRAAKAPAKSPTLVVRRAAFGLAGGARVLGRGQVEAPLAGVVDLDQLRGGARLLEGLGDHQRDGLVVVLDLGAAQQLGGVELPLPSLPAFSR